MKVNLESSHDNSIRTPNCSKLETILTIKTISSVESRKHNPEIPEKTRYSFMHKRIIFVIVITIAVSQCLSLFVAVLLLLSLLLLLLLLGTPSVATNQWKEVIFTIKC